MSRKAINNLLGQAMIDDRFARKLLADPLQAALEGGFDLTVKERAILQSVKARNIAELSQVLLEQLEDEEQKDS
jgi:hypothetical protein